MGKSSDKAHTDSLMERSTKAVFITIKAMEKGQ